jgi:hypothetical protein
MKNLFLTFVKGIILLMGMAMLAGGGICSISLPFVAFSQKVIVMKEMEQLLILFFIAIAIASAGYALIRLVNPTKNNKTMNLKTFLEKIQNQQPISFKETMAIIDESYDYKQTEFSNGLGEDKLISPAGVNQGSCKIFAFAQLHNLMPEQTLNLFGDYYHVDVLQNPDATDHQNIRNFMKYGWEGISFQNQPLLEKKL